MTQEQCKGRAARAAFAYLDGGMKLGVGTGSTVDHFIDALPEHASRVSAVVSSSERTTQRLRERGFEVAQLADTGPLDLYVDGADEATKHLHLIKGGGGALTREKVLAAAARRFVCIVDESKVVGVLGTFPLPVEVIPMARSFVSRQLIRAGGQPIWREGYTTDNGLEIIDVHNLKIANPLEVETRFNQIPGVVTVGLFAHRRADILLVGTEREVRILT